MIGPVGRESVRAIQARFGKLEANEVCACEHCLAWDCDTPPVAVPAGGEGSGREFQWMARWIHGAELKAHRREQGRLAELGADLKARREAAGAAES